jgi:hypothetical protein
MRANNQKYGIKFDENALEWPEQLGATSRQNFRTDRIDRSPG